MTTEQFGGSVDEVAEQGARDRRRRRNSAARLVDIGSRGIATQSSDYSANYSAQGAVSGDFSADFTVHTKNEQSPWWKLDLRSWYRVDQIIIRNRQDLRFQHRAQSIQVAVSGDQIDWTIVHSGTVFFGADNDTCLRLPLAGKMQVRFIKLSLSEQTALHLNRVEVLIASAELDSRTIMEAIGIQFTEVSRWSHGGLRPEKYRVIRSGSESQHQRMGLRIVRSGRFANNVIQQVQAIQIALNKKLDFVQMLDSEFFNFETENTHEGLQLLESSTELPAGSIAIEGDFFSVDRIRLALSPVQPDDAALVSVAKKWLSPYLSLSEPAVPAGEDELLIHVRSGDLFGDHPHPAYGQPPLSFYIAAVERASSLGFTAVRVVAEDRLNPVVDALEAYLQSKQIPFVMQLGNSLAEDLATLLTGRALVFGRGTFGVAVCMLSRKARVVFEAGGNGQYRSMFTDLELLVSGDIPRKSYGPFQHWDASPEQKQQMLEYPREGIAFSERRHADTA